MPIIFCLHSRDVCERAINKNIKRLERRKMYELPSYFRLNIQRLYLHETREKTFKNILAYAAFKIKFCSIQFYLFERMLESLKTCVRLQLSRTNQMVKEHTRD